MWLTAFHIPLVSQSKFERNFFENFQRGIFAYKRKKLRQKKIMKIFPFKSKVSDQRIVKKKLHYFLTKGVSPVGIAYKNTEGYCDPVPYAALSNIDMEKKKFRPIVYICSPFSGDIEGNTRKACKYSRFAVDQGAIPIAPHLLLPQYMDEKTERELAMQMDMVLLAHCLEIWVFGSFISEGMEAEIARAKQKRMTIRYFTEDLKEEEKCS